MKKLIVLVLCLALMLGGCTWLDGEYHSVTPHASSGTPMSDDVVTVTGYNDIRDALVEMVTSGRQQSTFYIKGFGLEDVDQHMNTAIMHVFQTSAVGAYAVEKIQYEAGTSGGISAIAVNVTYIHGRQEILRIKSVKNMEMVESLIAYSLKSHEASTVIKVNEYEDLDVQQLVQEYVGANPHLCMELPQVIANIYPERGDERVLEIFFNYQTSRDALKIMQDMVTPIFDAAELYVQGSEDTRQKYEQLYAFLMERFDYKYETSITPAYSLLRYGVGDSKAIAKVYSTMCQNAELECRVVNGTKNGDAYSWNLIRFDDTDYHVDLPACSKEGEFSVMVPEEMSGYVWDYSEFQ